MADNWVIYNGNENGTSVERSVKAALDDYSKLTMEQLQKAVDAAGKDVLKSTRANAKRVLGKYRNPKEYVSGLRSSKIPAAMRRYGIVVHNKKKPGLAHLLQHGHAGPAPADAHPYFPSDGRVEEIFMKHIEKELGK